MIRILLLLLSAGLHALAFPPWKCAPLAWVALVPFFVALQGLRPWRGFWAGLLWGHATHWALAYWVPGALTFYYGQAWWFGVLFGLCTSPLFWAGYYALFAAAVCWVGQRACGVERVLVTALLWVSVEFARAHLLSGAPWLMLGYALVPHIVLIQAADLGGVYLLSFVVVFVNASEAETLGQAIAERRFDRSTRARGFDGQQGWLRQTLPVTLAAALLVVALVVYGTIRLASPLPETPAIPITVIQGNNQDSAQWRPGAYARGLEQYIHLSADAAARTHPRVIIWPEAAVTLFLAHEPQQRAQIAQMLRAADADLIVGAPHFTDEDPAVPRFLNSAFYLTADGRLADRYDKIHLLPFAEYFPLRTITFLRRRFERVRTFVPGSDVTLLETRLGRVAVVICFEAIFPELVRERMARGAEVLVNLSNDVWLGRGAGPEQHVTMVILRAVENRTWLIRATTTGVSAIVDPFGRVRARSSTFEPAVLDAQITPLRVQTVYKRYGDVFAYGCLLIAALALLLLWRRPDRAA